MVFGGTGGLDFVGGTAAATVFTAAVTAGGGNTVTAGSGGLLMASGGTDTVFGDATGGATLFGTSGSSMTYTGPGSILYGAGAGNETLSAGSATGVGTFFASTLSGGNDAVFGGSGGNIFVAGAGADTFAGGAGADTFNFLSKFTAGSGVSDVVYNLDGNDAVNLFGYDSTQSSVSVSAGNLTLTLSDNTKITFVDVTTLPTNIHYG